MGKIKKTALERHTVTMSPGVGDFVNQAAEVPLHQLPAKLQSFPQEWPLPRGDLYHWISLLNRFDRILELFNKEYGLDLGPQTQPFRRRLLVTGDAENNKDYQCPDEEELDSCGFSGEGDRELVESILNFTKILMEHCGNRSLYSSSNHVSNLLHTTSLSLLRSALRLGLRLAQRYQVARYKNHQHHTQVALQKSHYDFNVENLQRIAQAFPKSLQTTTSQTPASARGKDKTTSAATVNPSDLFTIAKDPKAVAQSDMASITCSYYDQSVKPLPTEELQTPPLEASPATPTPTRRASNLGPARDRPSPGIRTASDLAASSPVKSKEVDAPSNAPKTYHISSTRVFETPSWELVHESVQLLPKDHHLDILNRIRVAKAFSTVKESGSEQSQLLIETRLLAVANLAYALADSKFMEKVGQPDSDEPRRFHLATQLCELLQPSTGSQSPVTLSLEITILQTIEALAKTKAKVTEVAEALSINVNHGILYYELKKAITSLGTESKPGETRDLQELEWQDCTFDLIDGLTRSSPHARFAEKMVSAGIIGILVDVLQMRTQRAERFYEKVLAFFDAFIHGLREAFQIIANAKGLDAIADLTEYEVGLALRNLDAGNGMPTQFKSKVVDYDIPYWQQATLRQLFKVIVNMFENGSGMHDFLLRNLIDTPQILSSLRTVVGKAHIFGSNVFNGAISIICTFIHNEPTSYQVIAEAGLSKGVLEAIVQHEISAEPSADSTTASNPVATELTVQDGKIQFADCKGVLPVGETMADIPSTFGAICLNESGMKLFQSSGALNEFLNIFTSPEHVKALEEDQNTAFNVGSQFDELSRHHPQLKEQILNGVILTVKRVVSICKLYADLDTAGAKLWELQDGQIVMAGKHDISPAAIGEETGEKAFVVPFISACAKFLDGFFQNSGMTNLFCEQGGAELILALSTAKASPHDFLSFPAFQRLNGVIKTMSDAKPHLVLPSIISRLQEALSALKPFLHSSKLEAISYVDPDKPSPPELDGTLLVRSLKDVQILVTLLGRVFHPSNQFGSHRHSSSNLFHTMNFTDVYIELVDSLGLLHSTCIWEHEGLKQSLTHDIAQKSFSTMMPNRRVASDGSVIADIHRVPVSDDAPSAEQSSPDTASPNIGEKFLTSNARALRYLLHGTFTSIELSLHSLGVSLAPKRISDLVPKQNASLVAEHLADSILSELSYSRSSEELSKSVLLCCQALVLDGRTKSMLRFSPGIDHTGREALTLVLSKFYLKGGIAKLNALVAEYHEILIKEAKAEPQSPDREKIIENARWSLSLILSFYRQIVHSKCINDASQSAHIAVRDPRQADFFMPGQFIVELRNEILPTVSALWDASNPEHLGSEIKNIVDILKIILKGDGEERALKRGDDLNRRVPANKPEFKLRHPENLPKLTSAGYAEDLARESLYRCNGHENSATEYCSLRSRQPDTPRFPVPQSDEIPQQDRDQAVSDTNARQESVEMQDAAEQPSDGTVPEISSPDHEMGSDGEDGNFGSLGALPADVLNGDLQAMLPGGGLVTDLLTNMTRGGPEQSTRPPAIDTEQPYVTFEDLEEKREVLRQSLPDRCLSILAYHPNITFELTELIQAVVAKETDNNVPRAEIANTLLMSLMSLQGEEPEDETDEAKRRLGLKISSYAHLVALVIQDREFFISILDELQECMDLLVDWIHTGSESQKLEDCPWIDYLLLIAERVLAEDEQPVEVQWIPPPVDDPLKALPEPEIPKPVVNDEVRGTLFGALVAMLPKIGKNSTLALSISRILVILTRRRPLADRLREKPSMTGLFTMVKQLSGLFNERLHGSIMLILRHLTEDADVLRQIMRTEIKTYFDNQRRNLDTANYVRTLYPLVLRDPGIFVEMTQEMCELARYDGNPNRAQPLTLKRTVNTESIAAAGEAKDLTEGSTEEPNKGAETKLPPIETSGSVVHFLLSELSKYREVEDTPISATRPRRPTSSGDVEMADSTSSNNTSSVGPSTTQNEKDDETPDTKPVFKAEEHQIFVYRCFLLQALAELLGCYNRTKIEFIGFSRKVEAQTATPSKPRAGTLNYLINQLLPVGTLEHRDDIEHRKKLATSNWAISVLVSLCARTPEQYVSRYTNVGNAGQEESAELTLVRKFVLEHSLRSFKEALGSHEPLDLRYSRLLALGDLFNRMMNGNSDSSGSSDKSKESQQQLGKLMYEKNFIGTLTSAIAELDLNFPNAKRAVKYILRPLKWLTDLAISLSQTTDLSSSSVGNTTTEDDDISSATSVSDEEEREQTPDLFRNSALSMFEANNGDEDDSESDDEEGEVDEEMYEDEDEEMEYDEEIVPEHGDVVSDDEDEDVDGMGEVEGLPGDGDMDIEIVMDEDGEDGEDSDDEDEDEDVDDDELDHEEDYEGEFDEINGDNDNDSLADDDHDEGEWEDDDNGFDEEAGNGGSPHGGALDHIAHVIGADEEHSQHGDHGHRLRGDMGADPIDFEDELVGEPDPEDEDYDGDVVYEPEAEDEDDEEDQGMWALSEPQHGGLGIPNPFAVPGRHGPGIHAVFDGLEDTFRTSLRTHRQGSAPRGEDEGINPLLQRNGQPGEADRDPHQIGRPGRFMPFPRAGMFREFLNVIGPRRGQLNFDPRALGALNGSLILGDRPAVIEFGRPMDDMLQRAAMYDSRDPSRNTRASGAAGDEQRAVNFQIGLTSSRWQEEARMLFGSKHHEKAIRIINSIAKILVPPAMEWKRKRDIEDAERRVAEEKAREEDRKIAEAQRIEREALEKKEREEREAREAEERAAREAEERAREAEMSQNTGPGMEGVEQPEAQPSTDTTDAQQTGQGEDPTEAPVERVTINIRGRDLDITNLGIDREYLEALPEDMREEVIMSQFAEQRAQQVQSGEQPTEISRDFLDALPPDIRQEILRQEEADRRRREREETRRQTQQQAGNTTAQAEDMNNADFMAMLDPGLRQAILMDADDSVLSTLPDHLRHEAEMLGGPIRRAPHFLDGMGRGREGRVPAPQDRVPHDGRDTNKQRRPVVQMLDKAGIATLLRLMFVSLPSGGKTALHGILSDICKNTQNRAEVISILLSILQDGTADVSAVERSFAQLSLRAKQLSGPKTPQPMKRTVTNQMLTTPGLDLSPLNIVHQCLYTLTSLAKDNSRIPSFFLSEHETSVKSSKKGKSKEPWARFPINALLTLLDRKLIIENTGVMETLATLLSRVTHPLNILLRRSKEIQEDEKKSAQNVGGQATEQSVQPQPGDVTMSEAPGAGPSTETAEGSKEPVDDESHENEGAKSKRRDLVPPDVPEENLRLVVNILAARDCPSKTFSDTLDIIKNMSMIPGAKQVFAKELNRQAQDLGQSISEDLIVLTKHIKQTNSNADLQGMALASFSSSSAKQRKLLRVLIALDHIFDPKRTPSASNSGAEGDIEPKLKEDVLATLHESPTFEGLWRNLSACLTAIREKGNLVTVATILLPIIEALMVVCRNCKPKEPTQDAPTSPPPESRMEGLFFKFTDDHRKILNELIRNNPKLMNGNLAVLAKNSKVLEFDNKRNYFSRKLHHRNAEERVPHPSLQLNIRRDSVFLDSFKSLYFKSGNEIKYGKLNIRFLGEEGIDAGGVTREWFGAMARQMFNPDYALFNPVASDRTTFHPNPLSDINEQHLMFFKFIGRIIGKALYEGRLLDCHFSRAVYKRILSRPVALKDMETLDLDFYKSLDWMLNNDITGITFETFSTEVDRFGETKVIDLKPDGHNIEVTEENKQEYVRLIVQNRLIDSVQEQLDNFLTGFYEIIPKELVAIFNEQELELLISGLPDIDIDDWKNNTEYHNYQVTSPQIQWFWRAVRSFDKEEKAKLLQFVTGTSKVPLNGFKELEGMNGPTKFNIHRDYSKGEKLPTSHTCFNQLDLPEYETYEQLRQQLYTAITAGSDYFGFA